MGERGRIIAILTAAVVTCNSTGDALLRIGLSSSNPTLVGLLDAFVKIAVIGGVFLLLAGFVLELSLLSRADLTFVRPLTSTTYVVVALLGAFALGEYVSPAHWCGVALILAGVIVVSRTNPLTSTSRSARE